MADKFSAQGMLDTYLFECEQLLEQIQKTIWEQKDKECFEEESIHEIFRDIHTIKGTSGMMMFDEITRVSHKLEDVLYYLRESRNKKIPHAQLVEQVLKVTDFISGELTKIGTTGAADGNADEYVKELEQFLDRLKAEDSGKEIIIEKNVHMEPQQFYIPPKSKGVSSFYKIHLTFREGLDLANVHAYKIVHALKEIAEDMIYEPEDIIADDNTAEEILKKGFDILLQTQSKEEELRKILKTGYAITNVDIISGTAKEYCKGFDEPEERDYVPGDFVIESKEPGKGKKLAKDKYEKVSYIRVDVKKMDLLMELLEELTVSQTSVLGSPDLRVAGLNLDNFDQAAERMMKVSCKIQNIIMSMRMMSLNHTFQKMNRIVFETARKLEKEIDFEMIGEDTELDKNIVEHISAPLMHLVRNSVDHGIETPEERKNVGKNPKGKITLSARIDKNMVWICVEDDGKGLNRDKILQRARKLGLLENGKAENEYTEREVYQLITVPGFSTRDQITEYSGRGVGLDVVVANLQEINGNLEIESNLGQGTKMILKIPCKSINIEETNV